MKNQEKDPAAVALGRRVSQRRKELKISQKHLALAVGLKSQQGIQVLEAGGVKRPKFLRELAKTLRVTEDFLLYGSKKPPHQLTPKKRPLVETYDPDTLSREDDNDPVPALNEGGRHNVPEGEIPQVSAMLRMGYAADAQLIEVPAGHGSIAAVEVVATWKKVPESVLRRRLVGSLSSVHIVECEGDSMEPRIHDGDFVFIDTSRRTPSPPGIFALNDGFSQTLKRIEIVLNTDPPRVKIIPENPRHETYERLLEEVTIIGRYLCRLTMD